MGRSHIYNILMGRETMPQMTTYTIHTHKERDAEIMQRKQVWISVTYLQESSLYSHILCEVSKPKGSNPEWPLIHIVIQWVSDEHPLCRCCGIGIILKPYLVLQNKIGRYEVGISHARRTNDVILRKQGITQRWKFWSILTTIISCKVQLKIATDHIYK